MIGEDSGGWSSPYADPGDLVPYAEPPRDVTGVPVEVHAAILDAVRQLDVLARELATVRELCELIVVELDVELPAVFRRPPVVPQPLEAYIAARLDDVVGPDGGYVGDLEVDAMVVEDDDGEVEP